MAPDVVEAGVFRPDPGGVRVDSDGAANVGIVCGIDMAELIRMC